MTRRRLLLLILVPAVIAAVGLGLVLRHMSVVLDAPEPIVRPERADSLPSMPVSVIEAPVTYDLRTAIDSLEAAVPRTYGDLERRIPTANNRNVSYAFLLHRSPFRVAVRGQTVSISADVEYSGRAWYKPPVGPELEVSCGTAEPRRAVLTVQSTAMLTPDWNLRTRSRVLRLAAYSDSERDRCRLTFLRIDVTDRILEGTRLVLDQKLALFDDAVARWPIRPRFEKIWRDLQKPLWLADSVYPPFANLRLLAEPRVTTGPRPRSERSPLPALRRTPHVGRGARVLIDASFTYPVATAMLRRALVGMQLEGDGHRIRIRDVRIAGIGAGQVALGVRISGDVRGRVFFTGTPTFNPATHRITVPDLDYDVGTARVLVAGYEWLNDVRLRDVLREGAQLPDSGVVRRLATLAERGINRTLPGGTRDAGGPEGARDGRRRADALDRPCAVDPAAARAGRDDPGERARGDRRRGQRAAPATGDDSLSSAASSFFHSAAQVWVPWPWVCSLAGIRTKRPRFTRRISRSAIPSSGGLMKSSAEFTWTSGPVMRSSPVEGS